MTTYTVIAALAFCLFTGYLTTQETTNRPRLWRIPAGLSLLFFLFSLFTIITEGPVGFWVEHTRNLWGNQIWFDLLLAVGIGCFLLVPQAKKVGLNVWVWLVLIICTGSIGFLAFLARVLYEQEVLETRHSSS
jgi:hypothetical protein